MWHGHLPCATAAVFALEEEVDATVGLSDYEKLRLENIKRNEAMMEELGLAGNAWMQGASAPGADGADAGGGKNKKQKNDQRRGSSTDGSSSGESESDDEDASDSAGSSSSEEESYAKKRERNIASNEAVLQGFGLGSRAPRPAKRARTAAGKRAKPSS